MNVRDALDDGRYTNKVPYEYTPVPVDEDRMTVRQAKEHEENEKRKKQDQRRLHREEDTRLNALLRTDLEEEHGLVGHPKADRAWDLAWEHGHSSGYSDIIYYYEDFAELVK